MGLRRMFTPSVGGGQVDTRRTLYKYKGDRCVSCGEKVQDVIDEYGTYARRFHFNHIDPEKKHPDYDNIIKRKLSDEVLDEVDKCQLFCSNCHGTAHAQNITGVLTVTSKVGRRKLTQSVKCQAIHSRKKRTLQIFGEGPLKLNVYRATMGGMEKGLFSHQDLESGPTFTKLLQATRERGELVLSSLDGEPILRAKKLDEDSVQVETDVRFTAIKVRLTSYANETIWGRNGKMVTSRGRVRDAFRYQVVFRYSEMTSKP